MMMRGKHSLTAALNNSRSEAKRDDKPINRASRGHEHKFMGCQMKFIEF